MDKKGVIIHLDNDPNLLDERKRLFDQCDIELDYITCTTKEEFRSIIEEHKFNVKALVFDLLSTDPSPEELQNHEAEFLEEIKRSFASLNIPVFIYSGFLQALGNQFDNYGTVFKIDKGEQDFKEMVIDKIALLHNSGFIDVFCPGGTLDLEIRSELNNSFTKQFSSNKQIEDVIKSIIESKPGTDSRERVKNVFKRITVKTLASDLLSPVADSEDKVHPIEHFYRRQSKLDVWTGDIWNKTGTTEFNLVLTPRCDLATGKAKNIMYVKIDELPKPIVIKGKAEDIEKNLRNYLTDNLMGKSTRYIPNTVFFQGGMANVADHYTVEKEEFIDQHNYIITLSDDLTNEIIGKFAYYFLRTGITNISEAEFQAILQAVKPVENAK